MEVTRPSVDTTRAMAIITVASLLTLIALRGGMKGVSAS